MNSTITRIEMQKNVVSNTGGGDIFCKFSYLLKADLCKTFEKSHVLITT